MTLCSENKRILTSLLIILNAAFSPFAQGQNMRVIDSLQHQLQAYPVDTQKVHLLNELAWEYSSSHFEKGLGYAHQALEIAQKIHFLPGLATAYHRAGVVYINQRNYTSALDYYKKALPIEEKLDHQYGIARAENQLGIVYKNMGSPLKAIPLFEEAILIFHNLNLPATEALSSMNLGDCYAKIGNQHKALANYLKALKIYEKHPHPSNEAKLLLNLGNLHDDAHDYSNAIDVYKKALLLFEESSCKLGVAEVHHNLGATHSSLKDYEMALRHLDTSLTLQKELGTKKILATTYLDLGRIHIFLKKDKEARDYFQQSLQVAKETSDLSTQVSVHRNLGLLARYNKDYTKAIQAYRRGLKIARQIRKPYLVRDLLDKLSSVHAALGDYETSYTYEQEFNELNDSLETGYREAMYLKDAYEEERAQRIILEKEQTAQQAEVEKLDAENQLQDMIIYGLGIGAVLIIGLLASLVAVYRGRQKVLLQEKHLKAKEQEIEDLLVDQELKSMGAMLEGQEKERNRIAQDLHDRLGGMLSVVKLNFQSLEEQISTIKAQNFQQYEKTNQLLDEACQEVRKVAHDVISGVLRNFGLIPALEDLKTAIESTKALDIRLIDVGFENRRLDAALEITVYRILQELISNILKHAQAKNIDIQLFWKQDVLNLTVEDDGRGFDLDTLANGQGMGLKNIESRLRNLDGNLQIDSQPGHGASIIINIPL